MKKTTLLLSLMLIICWSSSAFAESIYEKPILFRGIEWGTPYNEVVESYENKGETVWKPDGLDADFFNGQAKHYGEVGFAMRSGLPEGETVAGYEVDYYDGVHFNFVYTPDETGRLSEDKDHAVLCFASYMFDFGGKIEEYNAALEDLTNKLTLLYGDIDSEPSAGYGNRAVWKGAEGTLVSLYCNRGSYLNGGYYYRIFIQYSFEGMEDLLQDAKAALDKDFASITDGL